MLQERIKQQQRAARLRQQIAAMPEYPIYRERDGRYSIYIAGRRHRFDSETAAREAQSAARDAWLRYHSGAEMR